ncbi:hypothetical protein A2627_00580 [Candidatus Woesebacteria bacterium RIFCSPHIGHO2_01_FULL_39_28]|uniref:PPM-type phosphatase domain-containing protein n=1 Tax=Candidatus Woesebacteria bacterium RIFCSPHIGHO2_01_FULL_39_28 TaxID=1802496 RepID=A0A1F7YL55_9BACT|nr:MAG: hypothetical protein A2627_00580 [Candidatus Woesebacteria bacterium RIFCSPHIGHO2_01_FULL_39_28]OGM56693.1 MAG: hypothetical protein A3A50_05040 [Candidatus Woesebacteria bacterium RIFCSPLOWO2_01_FULL_38_20]
MGVSDQDFTPPKTITVTVGSGVGTEIGGQPEKKTPAFSIGSAQELGGRSNQEDRIFASQNDPLWVLADGMGGQLAGEVASDLVATRAKMYENGEFDLTDAAGTRIRPPLSSVILVETIRDANKKVNDINRSQDLNSGSTATALAITEQGDQQVANIVWVGDSPAYIYTPDKRYNQRYWEADSPLSELSLLTQAHSYKELGRSKGVPIGPELENAIYKSVGDKPNVQADSRELAVNAGDVLLLCSDGLEEGGVTQTRISEVLALVSAGKMTSQEAASLLTTEAKNGSDNISVIVVKIEEKAGQNKTIVTKNLPLKKGVRWEGTQQPLMVKVSGEVVEVHPFLDPERRGRGYYYDKQGQRIVIDLPRQESSVPEWKGIIKGDEVVLEEDPKNLDTGWKLEGFDPKTGEAILRKRYMGGYMDTRKIARDVLNELNNPFKTAEEWSRIFIVANGNVPDVARSVKDSNWEASVGGKAALISVSQALGAFSKVGLRADLGRKGIVEGVFKTYQRFENRTAKQLSSNE